MSADVHPDLEMNIRQAVPFFWIKDMNRSLLFYEKGLGFSITKRWEDQGRLRWCMLERDQVALMLQEFGEFWQGKPAPAGGLGLGVSICFFCRDAIGLYHEFRKRNMEASRPFVGNGMWVTSLKDPDGYDLQFESYTDVPEETVWEGGKSE